MSGTTSVPSPSFTDRGFIVPAESDVLQGVLADINAAFGGGMSIANADGSPNMKTPQGQLASSEAAIIGDKNNLFLFLTNMVDPAYASGRMQDAIGRIYFLDRNPAQSTVVQALCSGGTNVRIPTGTKAQSDDGRLYFCTSGGVIPPSGSITLPFACTETGPITCPANTLRTPYQSISGWDSITNVADGVIGNDVESRAEFEARRSASVAINATGSLPSVLANVLNVPGVLDAFAYENVESTPLLFNGYTLLPHSLYVAVVGGNSQDIVNAIWRKKSIGCNYNGNTAVYVVDSNYSDPKPTYLVKFNIPTNTPVKFAVVMAASSTVPSNAADLIRTAIILAFAGADGGSRARIGSKIFASRFYGTIMALGTWAEIVSIELGTATPTLFSILMQIDQVPTVAVNDISVTFV